jgi:hypothetical protein
LHPGAKVEKTFFLDEAKQALVSVPGKPFQLLSLTFVVKDRNIPNKRSPER